MKGIYKGFKYTLSQFFVVKEEDQELQIGDPTDVKHVAHIGWDGNSGTGTAPSWMNGFKTGDDFATTSIGNTGSTLSPWSSLDSGDSMRRQSESEMSKDLTSTDLPNVKKKERRKKPRPTSPQKSRPSRPQKPKPNENPTDIEEL